MFKNIQGELRQREAPTAGETCPRPPAGQGSRCCHSEIGKAKSDTGVVNTRQKLTDIGGNWGGKGSECNTSPTLTIVEHVANLTLSGSSRRHLQNSAELREGCCSRGPVESMAFPRPWAELPEPVTVPTDLLPFSTLQACLYFSPIDSFF